jgi:hypothetical protein
LFVLFIWLYIDFYLNFLLLTLTLIKLLCWMMWYLIIINLVYGYLILIISL